MLYMRADRGSAGREGGQSYCYNLPVATRAIKVETLFLQV